MPLLKSLWQSEELFERNFMKLSEKYPKAVSYLQSELYPSRSQWADCFVAGVYTGDIHTTFRYSRIALHE